MKLLSATDFAIARAIQNDTLRLVERAYRFGPFIAIEDHRGIIEVADDMAEAERRVNAIKSALN